MEIIDDCTAQVRPGGTPALNLPWLPGQPGVKWTGEDSANPLIYGEAGSGLFGRGLTLSDPGPAAAASGLVTAFPPELNLKNQILQFNYSGLFNVDVESGGGGMQRFIEFVFANSFIDLVTLAFEALTIADNTSIYLDGDLIVGGLATSLVQFDCTYSEVINEDEDFVGTFTVTINEAASLSKEYIRIPFLEPISALRLNMRPITAESATGQLPFFLTSIFFQVDGEPIAKPRITTTTLVTLKNARAPASVAALSIRRGVDNSAKLANSRLYSLRSVTLKPKG